MRSENGKNILLGVLIVGLIGMTIAYAALSTTLNISGTANVAAASWDIRLSDLTKASNVASAVTGVTNTATGPASVSVTNGTAISGLAVTLNQPGDKVVYNFTISNNGSIDAKLSSFTAGLTQASTSPNSITSDQIAANFSHSITCSPTQASNADYLNKKGTYASPAVSVGSNHDVANCSLTIQWNEATNSGTAGQAQTYTQQAVILDYSATWVYVQN